MTTNLTTRAGIVCLMVGPTALLAQALVTPVDAGGGAAAQVADAASDLAAMRWALLLDVPLLLLVPAVLYLGAVAGARQSAIAAVGAGLAFIGTLAAVLLLANDILLYEAATSKEPAAISLVDAYQHNALFGLMLVLYLTGQAIGCVLLAVALWRRRTVPRSAAVAVGAFPILGLAFAPAGAALAVVGFGMGALELRRRANTSSPPDTSVSPTPART